MPRKSNLSRLLGESPEKRLRNTRISLAAVGALLVWAAPGARADNLQILHTFSASSSFTGVTIGGSTLYGIDFGGTAYSMNLDGSNFQVLHSFTSSDGIEPMAPMTLVGSKLYGTTIFQGPTGLGDVFSMNLDGSNFQVVHAFTGGIGGAAPAPGLTLVGSTLYGTAAYNGISGGTPTGDGTVFSMNLDGSNFQTLHAFTGGSGGALPFGGTLTLVGSTLFGTTSANDNIGHFGQGIGAGTVFSINLDGSNFQTIHSFISGSGEANPRGGLTLIGPNTLVGTTSAITDLPFSPTGPFGTAFSMNLDGSHFQTLHAFTAGADGSSPNGSLTLSGTTLYGIANCVDGGVGQVFSVNLDGSNFQTVQAFSPVRPSGTLALDGSTLYGTTANSVFSLAVPEPDSIAIAAVGLAALAALALRRRAASVSPAGR